MTQAKVFEAKWLQALATMRGVPYVLGGQGPKGNDCSGLIVDAFKLIQQPIVDRTATQLYEDLFTLTSPPSVGPSIPCLFQFKEAGKIIHVSAIVATAHCGYIVFDNTSSRGYADYDCYTVDDREWERRFLNWIALLDEPMGKA